MQTSKTTPYKLAILIGYALTLIGCLMLLLGLIGAYDFEIFSFGISSGIRIIASIAISGCLISAATHFFFDLQEQQT
ncbi:hypothetical protein [Polynucleobacter brandtiae]|nr:hypothetical protein [Polynucleobacter brandtiae]